MGRILKSYFFWTYERGSFHYDVMVTLILAFLFITPHLWNYGDHPTAGNMSPSEVLVKSTGQDGLIYQIPAERIPAASSAISSSQLSSAIAPISGQVVIDHYVALKDASGKTTAYKVWAHR